MDEQVKLMNQNLLCLGASEENTLEKKTQIVSDKLEETEICVEFTERLVSKLKKTINDLEGKLKCTKEEDLVHKGYCTRLLHLN
uniref:Uncharacterized protein n=1 Tax=Oryctolagus cuniculus TaxID=9986 RepID=A0A5F9D9X1_RABIT